MYRAMSQVTRYETEVVTFVSNGTKITGRIFIPTGGTGQKPAVTIIGPVGFVKEQSPLQYGTRLAKLGFIALTWDARYFGESEGEPRLFEDPMSKIQDIKASVDYLENRKDVDKTRIFGVGICQGASWMLVAAVEGSPLKAIGLIAGSYVYPEHMQNFYNGKPPTVDERIARGRTAKEKFEKTGQVDYRKFADFSNTDTDVAVPYADPNNFYGKWENGTSWQNKYTTMTDAITLTFDINTYAKRLQTPVIFVHGNYCDGFFVTVQNMFDKVPQNESKQLVLYKNTNTFQTEFYESPTVIDKAVADVVEFFQKYFNGTYVRL